MGAINNGRVLVGGLLAGLVFNIGETLLNAVVVAGPMQEIAEAHNLQDPGGPGIGIFVLMGFALGVLMTWFYAAARPRLGPGPKTAAIIGAALWFPSYLIPIVGWVVLGLAPLGLGVVMSIWGLVEMVLSAVAGGWLYQES